MTTAPEAPGPAASTTKTAIAKPYVAAQLSLTNKSLQGDRRRGKTQGRRAPLREPTPRGPTITPFPAGWLNYELPPPLYMDPPL